MEAFIEEDVPQGDVAHIEVTLNGRTVSRSVVVTEDGVLAEAVDDLFMQDMVDEVLETNDL